MGDIAAVKNLAAVSNDNRAPLDQAIGQKNVTGNGKTARLADGDEIVICTVVPGGNYLHLDRTAYASDLIRTAPGSKELLPKVMSMLSNGYKDIRDAAVGSENRIDAILAAGTKYNCAD